MTARRVLLTTDVVGGVWDFCLVLAAGLYQQDATEVTLLAIGQPSPAQRQQAAHCGADLRSAPLKLEWMQDAEADVGRTRRWVAEVVLDVRPDVLHANQFAAACADVAVPVVLTLHSDVLTWNRWTNSANPPLPLGEGRGEGAAVPDPWHAYAGLVRQALGAADEVVAVTRFLADEVQSLYSVVRPVRVIHNGWPAATPPAAQREHITLLAGRTWDSAKNISLAAEAADGWRPGSVFLAGSQTHPETAALADIQPPLQPLGFLPRAELDAWLRRAAIYLSPARYDPFGLLPLQAALNGCALLLSDIPSYRELWDGAACFFRSNDAADLRRQWQDLLGSPEHLAAMQSRATRRARNCYTPASMLAAYRTLYAQTKRRVAA